MEFASEEDIMFATPISYTFYSSAEHSDKYNKQKKRPVFIQLCVFTSIKRSRRMPIFPSWLFWSLFLVCLCIPSPYGPPHIVEMTDMI